MIQRIYAIFARQMYLERRSPHRALAMFYWPIMELFIWGLLTVYLNELGATQFNLVTVLLSALIFWNFFNRAQQAISVSFLEDVWVRNVGNVFASPIRPLEYLVGLILVSIFQSIVSLTLITIVASMLWQLNIFQFGFWLIPFMVNLFMTGWAFGILAVAITLRLGPSAEILAWALPVLIQPLSAVFYPVSILPKFLQVIAHLLPTSYIFEGMRAIVLENNFSIGDLALAFGLNIFYLLITIGLFFLSYRSVRRRGVLHRYSE